MILRFRKVTRYFLFLSDLLMINGSVWLGKSVNQTGESEETFVRYALLMNLLWVILVLIRDRYQSVTFVNISKATFRLLFTHFLLLITSIYLFEPQEIPRNFIVVQYALLMLLVLLSRYVYLFVYRRFSLFRHEKRKVVIIGNGEMSYKAASYLARPDSGYEFVGVFNDADDPRNRLPMLGKRSECIDYCVRNGVKEIFSTLMPESGEELRELISQAEQECIRVKFIPDFKMIFARDVNLSIDNDLLMIRFRDEKLEKYENRIIKRAFDLLFTLSVTILILWWLIPILSILVWITSGRPIFFVQKRSGRDGRVFDCYKFRTMHINAEADDKAVETDDPRRTRFGSFLRRTSLDELPQFLNVLKGEMSVVGPRPHMLKHTRDYSSINKRYMIRHFLKPGITGWAQTNGYRGDITGNRMEERVKKDIWYIENWSFLLDVLIILKTIRLMLLGDRHAY